MSLSLRVLRLAGRVGLAAVGLTVAALVAMQFEGIVAKNVAIATELRTSNDEVATLVTREAGQRRTIARLRNPLGALPEIHAKLHLVGPNEEIIFVRGGEAAPAVKEHWEESQ